MSEEIPETYPALCPYIYYEDTAAMIDWLTNAFGFRERFKEVRQDGSLGRECVADGQRLARVMHIPDGYLSPQTCAVMYGAAAPFWVVAARRVRKVVKSRYVPLLALGRRIASW
jgi:Cobalt uptake substrate-specific transmembrane region